MNHDVNKPQHMAFCELLDRILNKGVVVSGDVTISVAGIDLVYINLFALLTSVESGRKFSQPLCRAINGDKYD